MFDDRVIRLMPDDAAAYFDVFRELLFVVTRDTVIPEIIQVFGDNTLKFLDIFAGTTIEVPSREVLNIAYRNTHVYLVLSELKKGEERAQRVKELAALYGVEEKKIRLAYNEACDILGIGNDRRTRKTGKIEGT